MRISDWSSDVCSSDLQHPDLDRADPEIIETGIDLLTQKSSRWYMHGADSAGVLRSERGNRAQAVHAVRGKGFQIRLDAGTATAIGAGDGERAQDRRSTRLKSSH